MNTPHFFRKTVRLTAAMALPLAMASTLGGCDKKQTPETASAAGGEVLPRSVTDDMPPYDTVRSQSPLSNPDSDSAASSDGTNRAAPAAGPDGQAEDDDSAETAPDADAQAPSDTVAPDAE